MRRQSWLTRLVLGSLVAGGLLAAQVPQPSRAECTWGIIYITRKNATSIPIWGPGCITPNTPWLQNIEDQDDTTTGVVPDGTPNGYYYHVLLTSP